MRIGQVVWHAKRKEIENATIAEFEKPVQYVNRPNHLTIMPATARGYLEVLKHGEDIENTWTGIANSLAYSGVFKAGDVMWIDGEKPNEELEDMYGYGCTANAIITSVIELNQTISLTLKTNKRQVK